MSGNREQETTREKPLTVTINPAMVPMLRGLARRNGRLVEWTVHEAIRRWLHEETAALHADDDPGGAPG